ncbi:hypothetical protein BC936DRAFT_146445 [Jimgerdemannia flammicorona]|uniref:Uncharacterized protein n=1 Tax=Jimgerdemannia flammicorona TaxID=994334 RepID=A0A433D7N5_9FUNG|nr:hypothetical protein BC936DRAFT_146445 [Jimgerdemannia flammicorona]
MLTRTRVFEHEILVGKLVAIDGFAARAIPLGEVSALAHELRDNAVEGTALETEPLLSRAEGPEVFCWREVAEQNQLGWGVAWVFTVDQVTIDRYLR